MVSLNSVSLACGLDEGELPEDVFDAFFGLDDEPRDDVADQVSKSASFLRATVLRSLSAVCVKHWRIATSIGRQHGFLPAPTLWPAPFSWRISSTSPTATTGSQRFDLEWAASA